jgi:hypothetical protein
VKETEELKMKKLIREIKNWVKDLIRTFIKSRFFLGFTCLVIGATYTYLFLVGVPYYKWADEGYSYTLHINTVEAEVALQGGGLVEAKAETVPLKPKPLVMTDPKGIEALITRYFGEESKTALAVFKTESGLSPTSMNWNCYYGGVSKQCKAEDREDAWSVDCGIAQINVIGKVCPEELFIPEKNIERAYAMFQKRGFQPWVSFVNNYHLANL